MASRGPKCDGSSLERCEGGDVVRLAIDGEPWLVRLGWLCRGEWFARAVVVDGDRIRERSEPFVIKGDAVHFLGRVIDRTWYAARNARQERDTSSAIDADPLRRVA